MKLPFNSIISEEKIRNYLLEWQPANDKSKFLSKAGYTQENWQDLVFDIREQILSREAEFVRKTPYGDMYEIRGILTGRNRVSVKVKTIWMKENKSKNTKFITLFPDKE